MDGDSLLAARRSGAGVRRLVAFDAPSFSDELQDFHACYMANLEGMKHEYLHSRAALSNDY
uniref:Uncharacterized protein n=1 Tax=Leersia perrieri TaxID=77586 RepID=A0A0D9W884_9ORYZ